MLKTGFVTLPITNDYPLTLRDVTVVMVVIGETNTERVLVNDVPVVERIEYLLPADGTVCKELYLDIKFETGQIPVSNPVRSIYLKYRKIINNCQDNG